MVNCGIWLNAGVMRNPSMADVTEMGGVIIPSASNAGLPICGVRVTAVGSSNADTTDAQGKYLIPCVSPKGSKTLLAVRTDRKSVV